MSEWAAWPFSTDVVVPRIEEGVVHYTIMEIVSQDGADNYWTLRHKVDQGGASMTVPTTNATANTTSATTNATLIAPVLVRPAE